MKSPAAAAMMPLTSGEKLKAEPRAPTTAPTAVYASTRPPLYWMPGQSLANLSERGVAVGAGGAPVAEGTLSDRAMPPHIATQCTDVSNPTTKSMP